MYALQVNTRPLHEVRQIANLRPFSG